MQKARTPRVAQASACVVLGPTAFSAVQASSVAKGNVLTVAQLAGIMAAKQTANLIPLCHSLALSKVSAMGMFSVSHLQQDPIQWACLSCHPLYVKQSKHQDLF